MNKDKNKGKRKTISLETKITILKRIAEGEGSTALGKEFGLGESTIRGIVKRAGEINKSIYCATNESAKRASYSRNILKEKTEKELLLWIQELTEKQIPVDGELIKEKAICIYNQLKCLEPTSSSSHSGSPKFSASNGWLDGFLKRHGLRALKVKGEAASADETAAENYYKALAKIIKDGGYCPDQVLNAGLFWKKMPSRTFIDKSVALAHGIGGEGFKTFSDSDVGEMTRDDGIMNCVTDVTDKQEEPDCMTADNVGEMIQDETVRNDGIVNHVTDVTDGQEEPDNMTADNVGEMIQDGTVRDDGIINNVTYVTDGQQELDNMTADKIYAGLQLCSKLKDHFLAIDTNCERTSKFQKELQSCISGYRDIYEQLVKQETSDKRSTLIECEVVYSSDESDCEPAHEKKIRVYEG